MRTSDCDILIMPGLGNSDATHWQSRWQEKLPTARRVEQANWDEVHLDDWGKRLVDAISHSHRPTVIVAHGSAVNVVVHMAKKLDKKIVKGAFFVAPAGSRFILEHESIDMKLAHLPLDPLPFPSVVLASHSDQNCPILEAEEWAYAWGSAFADAGDAGHLNSEAGYGPWPEGLMRFAGFLQKL